VDHRSRFALRIAACAAALSLALAAAACGGSSKPEPEKVTDTLRSYLREQAAGDAEAACSRLSPSGQRQLIALVQQVAQGSLPGPPSCEEAIGLIRTAAGPDLLRALRDARVENVRVDGRRATADVVGGSAVGRRAVKLEQIDDAWRISGVPGLEAAVAGG